MVLPRYRPRLVKTPKSKRPKRSLNELDDYWLTKIIVHAIRLAKVRDSEPFVGDTSLVERNLSLVSRRWYILTQTVIGSNGCHRIDLDELLSENGSTKLVEPDFKQKAPGQRLPECSVVGSSQPSFGKIPSRYNANSALAKSRRLANSVLMPKNYGNIMVAPSFLEPTRSAMKKRAPEKAEEDAGVRPTGAGTNDLRMFRLVQPILLKYKHIQLIGSLKTDTFVKLFKLMNAAKIEQLDLLDVQLEDGPRLEENSKMLQRCKKEQRLRLNMHLRDQKYSDPEEKVRYLVQWSKLADLTVCISALQRISIDCCHIMWSTGRLILNDKGLACNVVFRISLQTFGTKNGAKNYCELTIPFGPSPRYELNSGTEDPTRHRDILRAIMRGCYHTFVKCVRDYNTT